MSIPDPAVAASISGQWDRLSLGSPLRNARTARIVVAALVLILGFAIVINGLTLASLARANIMPTMLVGIAVAALASLVPIGILWYMDRIERESPWLYLAAVLWGAVVATGLAMPINQSILRAVMQWLTQNPEVASYFGPRAALMIGAPIAGPIVEEITKGLGIVLLFWLLRDEFDNMRDGFIYGALVGVGFNMLEAPLYVASGLAEYGFAPWGIQFGGRFSLFGLAGHAMYSGFFGAFLGLARQSTRTWVKWLAPIAGLLIAMVPHALNNALGLIVTILLKSMGQPIPDANPIADVPFHTMWIASSIRNLIIFFPFMLLMLLIIRKSGLWERAVLREQLADEASSIVTPQEMQTINGIGPFATRTIPGMSRAQSARIVNAQHELAFRKQRIRAKGADPNADPLIAGWRAEIQKLR